MIPYYKIVRDNLIPGFGTNGPYNFDGLVPIDKKEYQKLRAMMAKRPGEAEAGKTYILQNDPLAWVQIPEPEET